MRKNIKKEHPTSHCWNTRGVWSLSQDKCELLAEHVHCRNCPIFSLEGKRVLDRAAPVGYLKDWRKTLSEKKDVQNGNSKAVLVFRVNGEWFAIPAQCLHEITEIRTIHRIPRNGNKNICGVVNIGGEVRICYSFENIFGVKHVTDATEIDSPVSAGRFIVILMDGQYYVFCVEQISGLSWYSDDEILSVPATLGFESGNMIMGVLSHNKNNVAVLDADQFQRNLEGISL